MKLPKVGNIVFMHDGTIGFVVGFDQYCNIYVYKLCMIHSDTVPTFTKIQEDAFKTLQIEYLRAMIEGVVLIDALSEPLRRVFRTTNKRNSFVDFKNHYVDIGIDSTAVQNWYLSSMLKNTSLITLSFDYDTVLENMMEQVKETAKQKAKEKQKVLEKATLIKEEDLELGCIYNYPASSKKIMYYKEGIFFHVSEGNYIRAQDSMGISDMSDILRYILSSCPKTLSKLPKVEKTDVKIQITQAGVQGNFYLDTVANMRNVDLNLFL